mgnify:CR=1 FL=1
MVELHCDHITSAKRFLPAGSPLLIGDQVIDGTAIKSSSENPLGPADEEEREANRISLLVLGLDESTMLDQSGEFPIGTELVAGDFAAEFGFSAGQNGCTVVHSGYGGEARAFAAGTILKVGDLILNGYIVDGDGRQVFAPTVIEDSDSKVGADGAIVSPGGGGDDEAYCSFQELAGAPEPGMSKIDDFMEDLELDFNVPGLDGKWWLKVQQKINEITNIQGKLLAKTQLILAQLELDPENACKLVEQVRKLQKVMNKILKITSKIQKVLSAVARAIKALKRFIKLIKKLVKPIRVVEAILMAFSMVGGIPIMVGIALKNVAQLNAIIPQLVAVLSKVIAQCAENRGAEAGLTKEACESLGGTYVERQIGDLGDTNAIPDTSGIDSMFGNLEDLSDFAEPDDIEDEDLGAGLTESEIDALLDSQILDLSECMTELDDIDLTRNFS